MLKLWPELVSFEKGKRVLIKDPVYWPNEGIIHDPNNDSSMRPVYFTFKDFIHAFEIMSFPDELTQINNTQLVEMRVKFWTQLHKAIQRLNARSAAKTAKGKSPNTSDILSGKSTPEVFGSTGAAVYGKKIINNNAMGDKRPHLKKKLNQKLTDANTIKNVYINSKNLRKALVGIDKKTSKLKQKGRFKKKTSKHVHKRREYNLIDLTLNQNEMEDGSEFNFTTTETSLPPLEKSSKIGSESSNDSKRHERYSRSHERARDQKTLQAKIHFPKRQTVHEKDNSNNNSIIINENSITLASGNKINNRSDILSLKKNISFDKKKQGNHSEIKRRVNNATFNSNVSKGRRDPEQWQRIKQNLKLRNFAKSDKNSIENSSIRSNSRKSRILSGSSSKGKINLEEFTKLKMENQRYKLALQKMVEKFMQFKASMSAMSSKDQKASESGSSIVWKDKAKTAQDKYKPQSSNADEDMVKLNMSDDKDQRIASLQEQLLRKDKIIAKLKKELDTSKKPNNRYK